MRAQSIIDKQASLGTIGESDVCLVSKGAKASHCNGEADKRSSRANFDQFCAHTNLIILPVWIHFIQSDGCTSAAFSLRVSSTAMLAHASNDWPTVRRITINIVPVAVLVHFEYSPT
jgi:hypothetical protein